MIPEFLRRENHPKDKEPCEMEKALERYKKHFNDDVSTEPASWTEEEWVAIIDECIRTNTTFEEMFDMDYDSDDDY